MNQLPKTLCSFLFYFLKPHKKSVWIIGILGVFWAFETSLTPYLMKELIDRSLQSPGPFKDIVLSLWPFMLAYVGVTSINSASFRLREWILLKSIPALRKDIWSALYNYVMAHSYHFFQKNFSGSVANKISDISRSVDEFLTNVAETFLTKLLSIVIACLAMYWVNPLFACVLIVWCASFLTISLWSAKKAGKLAKSYSEDLSLLIGKTVDGIVNNMNIRLFSRQSQELRTIQRSLSINAIKDQNLQKYLIKLRTLQDITLVAFLAFMLILLIYLYSQRQVSVGDFAFIMTLSLSMINGTWILAGELVKIPEILGRFSQGMDTLSIPHEVQDIENAQCLDFRDGKIEFKHVDFCYGKDHSIFKNLNLTINSGETIGLVGPSGSGKTSLINLILRYYDIQGGVILIDDQDITKVTQSSLRQYISVIPQDVSLFHRSIFDNIRYGNPGATEKEIIHAAKKANAHSFIMKLKKGYKTIAEERGSNLSGGQRQRIAIARAILKNAPILILDEATSALDAVTEKGIQQVLDQIMQKKTCLIVAHKLSTITHVDRILVFKEGRVIEEGSHKDLLKRNGYYAHLWGTQMGEWASPS